jgi:DNA-binding NtrC family response regulator
MEDHRGLLEQADGSDLFLDELETLSPEDQAKLLCLMDDGEVRPVGSAETRQVSVRFLAATNRDPKLLMEEGKLREDFLYRVRGLEIHLPPLRERLEDIPILVKHFLRAAPVAVSEDAMAMLLSHDWSGNVRELRNVVQAAREWASAAKELTLAPRHLERCGGAFRKSEAVGRTAVQQGTLRQLLWDSEKRALMDALQAAGGNRSEAARMLGIDRRNLLRKIEQFGIEPVADEGRP